MTRRQFLISVGAAGGAYVCGRVAWAHGQDTWNLRLSKIEVPLPRLPLALEGLRVVHVTDLHLGKDVPDAFVRRALEMAASAGADVIALTGDFVSYDWRNLKRVTNHLQRLRAPLGVYACLGNHDTFCERARYITRLLMAAGVEVLTNRATALPGHARAWMVGIGDPTTAHHDFDTALQCVPLSAFKLLLSHAPDIADAAADLNLDLALTGHTHGGQVNLPVIGPTIVPSRYGPKYAWGLFDCRGTRLFVNRGVGVVPPALRFRCPPEVAVLTLRRGEGDLPTGRRGVDLRPLVRGLRGTRWRLNDQAPKG